MNGPELAERLKRTRRAMRVLHVSGYAESPTAHHGSLDGAFLEKPIVPGTFLRKLREAR